MTNTDNISRILIENVNVVFMPGETRPGWLLTEGDRIAQVGELGAPDRAITPTERIDGNGATLLPGFIDMHVHGAVNADAMDATPEGLTRMAQFYATHGVTSFLATTMTQSDAAIQAALDNIAACMGPVENGATILGAHLEGPYINVKVKGAQIGEYVRLADPQEYSRWLATGAIKLTTVAPEFPENVQFIRDCVKQGIVVSIGHTLATYDQAMAAIGYGARQTTHTFNAMSGIHHRNVGTANAALIADEFLCELIADNIHVHPATMRLLVQAKRIERVALITDAIRAAGQPDGEYELGGQPVYLRDHTATLADGTLAGSVLTMERALYNIMQATDRTLAKAWPMSSLNAARQLGLSGRKGLIVPSYDADIVLVDEQLSVLLTMVEGRIVYRHI